MNRKWLIIGSVLLAVASVGAAAHAYNISNKNRPCDDKDFEADHPGRCAGQIQRPYSAHKGSRQRIVYVIAQPRVFAQEPAYMPGPWVGYVDVGRCASSGFHIQPWQYDSFCNFQNGNPNGS